MFGNATLRTAHGATLAKANELARNHADQDVREVAQELIALAEVVKNAIEEFERHFPQGSPQREAIISRR
jgi:hypothetical protein